MVVVKLSRKGAPLFIQEDGCVFVTSKQYMNMLLEGRAKGGFIVLTKLPFSVPVGKFPVSPVFESEETRAKEGLVRDGLYKDKVEVVISDDGVDW